MMKKRVGVIGAGFGQQVHIPAFRSNPRCEVVAICASTQEKARKIADASDVEKAFGDWREIIADDGIDAVSIAVPPAFQPEIAIAAMTAGKAVFCEKPLAANLESARYMQRIAEQSGLANMVDFEFPEIPEWRAAKSIVESGELGAIRSVSVSWKVETYASKMGLKSWKTLPAAGGGTLNSFVSHIFHYIEWLIGPVMKLSANLFGVDGDTTDVLCLELESGIPVSVTVSADAFCGSGHRLEIYGSEGAVVLENTTRDYIKGFKLFHGTRGSDMLEQAPILTPLDETGDGRIAAVSRLVDKFINWMETGVPASPSFADGYRVQSLIEISRDSSRTGGWVDVGLLS